MNPKLSNILGIVCSLLALCGVLVLSQYSSVKEKPLATSNATTPPMQQPYIVRRPSPEVCNLIVKNDLFHPLRGKAPADKGNNGKPKVISNLKFELKGVFRSGNTAGALIIVMGKKLPNKNEIKKANADLYLLNSEISDGYVLKEINSDSIMIVRGTEKYEVLLPMLQPPESPASEPPEAKPSAPPTTKK